MKWQASTSYDKRALVESAIGRYKSVIGRRLRARQFHAQQTEVAIGCAIPNRMLACARPKSVSPIVKGSIAHFIKDRYPRCFGSVKQRRYGVHTAP